MTDSPAPRRITARLAVAIAEAEHAYDAAQQAQANQETLTAIDRAITYLATALKHQSKRPRTRPEKPARDHKPLSEVQEALGSRIATALQREGIETLDGVKALLDGPGLAKIGGIGINSENAIRRHFGRPARYAAKPFELDADQYRGIEERLGLSASNNDRFALTMRACLRRAGLSDPEAIKRMTDEELLARRGVGPTLLRLLREKL